MNKDAYEFIGRMIVDEEVKRQMAEAMSSFPRTVRNFRQASATRMFCGFGSYFARDAIFSTSDFFSAVKDRVVYLPSGVFMLTRTRQFPDGSFSAFICPFLLSVIKYPTSRLKWLQSSILSSQAYSQE